MKKKIHLMAVTIMTILGLSGCQNNNSTNNENVGKTEITYKTEERDRYDNIFRDNIPEQWENYGIGDPYLLRFNGEYYLFVSTKDNNPGYKCWKSHNLVNFEYLGHFGMYNRDGTTTTGQLGQYAPEIYYWNGEFYMYGSPSGHGHYIYKSTTGLPYGDYVAVTNNFGLSIDGSVFIDDDESMYFMVAGDGAITSYEMESMTNVKSNTSEQLFSPLIKWTEGPCMIKHNDTYYLTYTGNHVKSKGYRIDYSYSKYSPREGFEYPANNSVALKTLDEQNGLGHSSTVLGPNLDSYYMSYHSLDDSSGPIRSYNINRVSFTDNRMTLYGPTRSGAMAPVLPDFVNYPGETKMVENNNILISNQVTENRFSAEWNFRNINTDGTTKFLFGYNGSESNYITINGKSVVLFANNKQIGSGTLVNDFDFTKLHTIRLNYEDGKYRVFFDNLKKIDITSSEKIEEGKIGYSGMNFEDVGTTTFANDAFDSSDRKDAKIVDGNFFASNYLEESKLTSPSGKYNIEDDPLDADNIYSETSAIKLANKKDYLLYPIDVMQDGLYGIDATFAQSNAGSYVSIQIDNNDPIIAKIPSIDFSKNMNLYENDLKYVKATLAEIELTKGLHTIKFELVEGEVDFVYFDLFKDSKYSPNYTNDLSQYVDSGANYLSLWKIAEDEGRTVHKAKAGVNNMILFGNESMKDYEVSVDIKISVNSANNSYAGLIVRCNNPSLYSGQVDESAQGYLVAFNRMQLVQKRINYNSITTNVLTDDIGLNEYHNLRVVCKGNTITTYFDGEEAFSYTDAYAFSSGCVALYSINAESFYKNLSIKGV